MLSDLNLTPDTRSRRLSVLAVLSALLGTQSMAAGSDEAAADELYTWSAELVALDEANGTATVKSRVVNRADVGNLSELAEGDPMTIAWSGITWASGIRSITPGTEGEEDRFTLPAEFVSVEMDGMYVTFRVPVPSEAVGRIESVSPGEWVTLTSPHQPSGPAEAVVDVRPYNDVG